MKTVSIKVAAPDALVYILDSGSNENPEIDGRKENPIWVTPSCIAVSCMPESEGETVVTMGPFAIVEPDKKLLFDGWLETPSQQIIAESLVGEEILRVDVPTTKTRLPIWTDGFRDSARVTVGIG